MKLSVFIFFLCSEFVVIFSKVVFGYRSGTKWICTKVSVST